MDSRRSEDRIYTVYPYQSGKPPTTRRNRTFWIICAVIVCYVLLVGIIVVVVLLSPRSALLTNPNTGVHNRTEKPPLHPITSVPFKPSSRDPFVPFPGIDPRSTAGTRDRKRYHGKYPDGLANWQFNPNSEEFYLEDDK